MVEGTDVALALGAGLAATELTGITSITGGGSQQPNIIPMPSGDGGSDMSGAFTALATQLGNQQQNVGQSAQMAQMFTELRRDLEADIENATQGNGFGGNPPTPTQIPGPGWPPLDWPDFGSGGEGPGTTNVTENGGGSGGSEKGGDEFKLQDLYGTNAIGSGIATVAEAGQSGKETAETTGNILGGITDYSGKAGNTIGRAGELLATGSADTSGTFREGATGGAEVEIGSGEGFLGLGGNGNNESGNSGIPLIPL